jgi:hypothetical protein
VPCLEVPGNPECRDFSLGEHTSVAVANSTDRGKLLLRLVGAAALAWFRPNVSQTVAAAPRVSAN